MELPVYVNNKVIKGFGRGSKELGCPTANVDGANEVDIPTGIYCGLVQLVIDSENKVQKESGHDEDYIRLIQNLPYKSDIKGMVCSFGYNPQYGNKDKSLEVHILDDFKFNFYGAELRVLVCKKLRNEMKFNSLKELKDAIANDIKNAKNELESFQHFSKSAQYFV